MPSVYDDNILKINAQSHPDGSPTRTRVYSLVFPSIGFFPFYDIGNGDYQGFYWPIGREDHSPLVAFSSHDAYSLIPEYGDLAGACRCELATRDEGDLKHEFKEALAFTHETIPSIECASHLEYSDHQQLLTLDPNSPFRSCAAADQDVINGELESAEEHYRKAIQHMPEYGAAHFGLGYLLRRMRKHGEASIYFRKALICPLVFQGASFWADHRLPGEFRNDWIRKALMWLQNTKERDESLRDDPFLERIREIKLQTGVAQSRDLELVTAAVDQLVARDNLTDAIYLWMNTYDRAAAETTSFRERHSLTPTSYAKRLAELFRAAANHRRADLTESMLNAMDKPDGMYL